jgi:hypothetical protein
MEVEHPSSLYNTTPALMFEHLTVPANAEEPTVRQGGEGGVPASADHRGSLDLQTENCRPKW